MVIHSTYNANGTQTINIQYIIDSLDQIGNNSDIIIREVIAGIVKEVLEKKSAEIMSKIDTQVIANLASIELSKRAAKEVEK